MPMRAQTKELIKSCMLLIFQFFLFWRGRKYRICISVLPVIYEEVAEPSCVVGGIYVGGGPL